ncbi:hypothetical protein SAMN05660841_02886 [Sphingobacterium nematocida]|uniref:Uncharacterized protein n=1 Tax=Sphingobacterium nematocida TaxID=1513896 RepID=A0A1T5EYJ6_9SPHI|nr:hypothetical protein [Sphingobacterium nematocida]SKB88938.1 hypothetical protein SAMN05660841_02886 [Sphingobacterium nematocida]
MINVILLIMPFMAMASPSRSDAIEQEKTSHFSSRYLSKASPADSTYITLELYGKDKEPLDVAAATNINVSQYRNRSEEPHIYKALVPNRSIPRFIYVQFDDRYPIYFQTNLRTNRDVVYRLYLTKSK